MISKTYIRAIRNGASFNSKVFQLYLVAWQLLDMDLMNSFFARIEQFVLSFKRIFSFTWIEIQMQIYRGYFGLRQRSERLQQFLVFSPVRMLGGPGCIPV